jgi:hypothetical protein
MDVSAALAAMDAAVQDGRASLVTVLGGQRVESQVRLWQGQVLVDWEPDEQAGGCILRPALVRRLVALHAHVETAAEQLRLRASGHILTALSGAHAQLVRQLGGARKVEMRARLQFERGRYLGGEESYAVLERGRRVDVLVLRAAVSTSVAT